MRILVCLCAAAAALSGSAVSVAIQPNIVSAGTITDPMYGQTAGPLYSGVAKLLLTTTNGTFLCTGSVVGATSILTAGHCVTDGSGNAITTMVTAILDDGLGNTLTVATPNYVVHPLWNGNLGTGIDLTVVNFAAAFPSWVSIYALYNTNDELGKTFNVAGFGQTASNHGASVPGSAGTFHQGQNKFERLGNQMGVGWTNDNLIMDFDNGVAANDAFGYFYGLADLGLGNFQEVNTAPGDSGGPSFINGKVAGVTSFGTALSYVGGATSDCVAGVNSSCGEFSSMARVSTNVGWIQGAMVPEPATWLTAGLALVALGWRRGKRNVS